MRAPNPNGSGAANRPAQVFDVEIWNKLRQEASQSERIAAQAQDLTLIAICAYRQDIVNEGFSHLLPMELILGQCIMGLVVPCNDNQKVYGPSVPRPHYQSRTIAF